MNLGVRGAAVAFIRLKWHLLRGGLRGSTQQRIQTLVSLGVSTLFGVLAALILWSIGGSSASAAAIVVVLLPVAVVGVAVLSAAAGVEATIDPRNLATEPLTPWELGVGMLASAVVGPAAMLGAAAGAGLALGWGGDGPLGWAITIAVVVAWWATLVVLSRTTANVLGAAANGRLRQVAQLAASGSALLVWFAAQILARNTGGWTAQRWEALAGVARWTPPGQLGLALGATDRPAIAALHLMGGVIWLPLLTWVSVRTTSRLAFSAPRAGAGGASAGHRPHGMRDGLRGVLAWLPRGRVPAVVVRSVTTKVRTPRQSVNTVTALLVGAGVLLIGPILDGGQLDSRAVLVGGLLHFAVLFDGNNSFGMDGPALWIEVTSGADASVLARAKAATGMLVMAIPAVLVPVGLAAMSGGWAWLPAAWLIAAGSLAASAGVATASASLAPVALPDSPNPLAAGDTGQGCIAGFMLAAGTVVLGVVSAPVAVLIAFTSSRGVLPTTLAAVSAPVVGALTLWGCLQLARLRMEDREAELVQNVTPSR